MQFYSEFGEDEWIWKNVRLDATGFYLDIGCATPGQGNNTQFLRGNFPGWSGLAIDALGQYADSWAKEPNVGFIQAVLAASVWQAKFLRHETAGWSRLAESGGINISTRTIDELLGSHNVTHAVPNVDFLSVDCEGSEFDIMSRFNFKRFKPKVIVAEYHTAGLNGGTDKDYRLLELLMEEGYTVRHKTVANFIYTI